MGTSRGCLFRFYVHPQGSLSYSLYGFIFLLQQGLQWDARAGKFTGLMSEEVDDNLIREELKRMLDGSDCAKEVDPQRPAHGHSVSQFLLAVAGS